MVRLGDKVKDTITGFTGIAVVRSDWLTGCVRFGVEGKAKKDGGDAPLQHFDEERLIVVKAGTYQKAQQETHAAGPQRDPGRPV